jgi:hypothetical protein
MEFLALLFAAIVAFGFVAVLITGFALLDAIVLSTLWGWFIVPVFHLPALGLAAALGVSVVWGWLSYKVRDDEDLKSTNDVKENLKKLFKPIFRALVTLGIGFIIHLFLRA